MSDLSDLPITSFKPIEKRSNKRFGIKCSFCTKNNSGIMLTGFEYNGDLKYYDYDKIDYNEMSLRFCDLICAKLYNDNIHKITIDVQSYRKSHLSKSLDKNSELIYVKCIDKMFTQLPVMFCENNLSAKEYTVIKKTYFAIVG